MKRIGIDISVLNDKQKTGIAVYTYQLIKALLEINKTDKFVLFGIATFETFNYLKNIEFKKYPNVEIKVIKLPARLFRIAFLIWQKLNWPPIEMFIGKVDLYHSFNWYLPPQSQGKTVATVFDLTSLLYPEWHDKRTSELDQVRLERIAKDADWVITISENSKKDLQKYGVKGKIEVVYPAADQDKYQEPSTKYQNKKYFLSVATLEPRKNLLGLVKAYLELKTDLPLVLVGKVGWKSGELLDLISQHKDKIILKGFVSDEELKKLYQEAVCLVYPSFYEGFGMPVLEAMSLGIPVICSNNSSLPEVGGQAVIYIDPQNPEELVKAMERLQKDPALCKNLSKKGLDQAKKFSWKSSAEKLNLLYQRF